jgi:hypothetical protein
MMSDEINKPQPEANSQNTVLVNSEHVTATASGAKSVIDSSLSTMLAFLAKPWGRVFSVLTVCNKFTVAMLGVLLIAGYLPAIEMFSTKTSLYEAIEVGHFEVMVLAVMALYALGVKRSISKLASMALVLFVFYQLYEVYGYFSDLSGGRMAIDKRVIEMAARSVRYGLVLWVVSFIMVTILSFLPIYKTNEKLWPTIRDVLDTKSDSNINVQQYTSTINAGFQSAVSKGHATLKEVDLESTTNAFNNFKGASKRPTLMVFVVPAVIVMIAITFFSLGSSAPSEADVKQAFAKQGEINLGFVSGKVTNVTLNECIEIEDKQRPTFECNVDGNVKYDLGGLGTLFGGKSGRSNALNESFNESFIFIQGSRGWYIQE